MLVRPKLKCAVLVHRAGLQNDDVHRIDEAAVVIRHLAQVERHVVAAPRIVFLAVVSREVPTKPEEVFALRIALHHCTRLHREAGTEFHILQGVPAGGERLVEDVGLAQPHAVIEPHAGLYKARGLLARKSSVRPRQPFESTCRLPPRFGYSASILPQLTRASRRYPGPRSATPGFSPVTLPAFTTATPLTKTYSTPVDS